MKIATIKCQIQIDVFNTSSNEETKAKVLEALEIINLELQRTALDSSPQILLSAIDDSDIEIEDNTQDEE